LTIRAARTEALWTSRPEWIRHCSVMPIWLKAPARHALRFPLNIEDEKERLVLSTDTARIVVDGVPPHATATLIERLNARVATEQLASAVYLDQQRVSAILSVLHREGLSEVSLNAEN
jgi:hypothetical protein